MTGFVITPSSMKSVYYHTNFMVYSGGQVNETYRIFSNLLSCEGGSSRGLVREELGCVDPIRGKF